MLESTDAEDGKGIDQSQKHDGDVKCALSNSGYERECLHRLRLNEIEFSFCEYESHVGSTGILTMVSAERA